jgi:hypothetical protein
VGSWGRFWWGVRRAKARALTMQFDFVLIAPDRLCTMWFDFFSLHQGGHVRSGVSFHFHCTRSNRYNAGEPITQSRRRANSSLSTISMSNVPAWMSQAQLLSPRGLVATSRLFEEAGDCTSDRAKLYALRGEELNIGLGINVLGGLGECDDDLYEFCHTEESGGIPVHVATKKGGKKRRRDEKDVDGDFVAIDHYHLDEGDSSEDDEDIGIAQGGVELHLPSLFPKFGTLIPRCPPFLVQ